MSEFDDPQLENALGRLSGEFPDDNIALGAVYQRVQQVRRRRTIAASTAASMLLVAVVVVAAARGAHHDPLQPAGPGTLAPSTVVHTSTLDTAPSTTAAHHPTGDSTTTLPDPPTVIVTTAPPVNQPASTVPTIPEHVPPITTQHSTVPGSVPHNPPPTTAPRTPSSDTHTFATPGGSITVRFSAGVLTLVGYHPVSGFSVEQVQASDQHIDVRFRGPNGDYRVHVEVQHGQLIVTH
ncbi:MAG: hypothetical protein WCI22_17965 [Actinomycetota bacterium]